MALLAEHLRQPLPLAFFWGFLLLEHRMAQLPGGKELLKERLQMFIFTIYIVRASMVALH